MADEDVRVTEVYNLEGMLAKFDKDGDGKINRVEIREIMQTMLGTDDAGLERVGRLLSCAGR